jgi:hypothetical protein
LARPAAPAGSGPSSGPTGLAAWVGPALVASLTLGLAPFAPEPHVIGKLRWVAGGAVGMTAMDWGDLVLHGAPWCLLLVAGIARLRGGSASEP